MRFLLLFLLFWVECFAATPFSEALINKKGEPTGALVSLLTSFNIPHTSWEEIIQQTQEKWIRSPSQERWDIAAEDSNSYTNFDLFTQVNMTEPYQAEKMCYDYAVILGSLVDRVRGRIFTLKKEWERGVRFHSIVVLTGDRILHPQMEDIDHLIDPKYSSVPFKPGWHFEGTLPKNETAMIKLVFDQLDLPKEWKNIVYIDAPQKNGKRPNTEDTFLLWLKAKPAPGDVLIVSDQPFLGRADTLARALLGSFDVETIGEGVSFEQFKQEKRAVPIFQDELARWLFTIKSYNEAS